MNDAKNFKLLSQNYSILYAEDDEELQNITAELFESFFKKVTLAKDGLEALELYNTNNFDIVISDIQMPNMNGIELSKKILEINKSQKVVIISAYNETKYFIELIKIGVHGFIQKPLNLKQLREIFDEVCSNLAEEKNNSNIIKLDDIYSWNKEHKLLYKMFQEIKLSSHEVELLSLFLSNRGQKFTDQDIFNYIYYNDSDKEFSTDAVKSLIKRVRKKLPQDYILTHKNIGYSFKLTLS